MEAPSTSYRVLPVRLQGPGCPPITRYLYIKPHASAADALPKERAVFVAGVPVALQGPALVQLFAQFGEVERAALHGSRVSAVLLYAAAEARDKLLRAAAKGRPVELQLPEPAGTHGLKGGQALLLAAAQGCAAGACSGSRCDTQRRLDPLSRPSSPSPPAAAAWVEEHKAQKPGNAELQAELDEWMAEWEEEEARRRAEALAAQQDEGWTVVQRHKVGGGSCVRPGSRMGRGEWAVERGADFGCLAELPPRRPRAAGPQEERERERRDGGGRGSGGGGGASGGEGQEGLEPQRLLPLPAARQAAQRWVLRGGGGLWVLACQGACKLDPRSPPSLSQPSPGARRAAGAAGEV